MLGDVNKLLVFKSLLTTPSNVLPLYLEQTFLPIIRIFTEGDGDGIESRLPFKTFSTLKKNVSEKQCDLNIEPRTFFSLSPGRTYSNIFA